MKAEEYKKKLIEANDLIEKLEGQLLTMENRNKGLEEEIEKKESGMPTSLQKSTNFMDCSPA